MIAGRSSQSLIIYMSSSSLEAFLIAEVSYSSTINILFCVLFCRKVLKLDKMGDNLDVHVPRTTWLKFAFVLITMLLMLTHIVLAFADPDYWEYTYSTYSLATILFLVNYTMQLYIIVREVRKCNGRHFGGLCYWVVVAASALVEVIVVENLLPHPSPTMVLQVLICLANTALVMITLIFERINQKKSGEMLNVLLQPSVRSIEQSIVRNDALPASRNTCPLYIEFNKEFQIIQDKDRTACEFKIAVYFQEVIKIITKSQDDFLNLAQQMASNFPQSPEVILPPVQSRFENVMKYGEERQKLFESYMVELIKTDQFYCPPLLEFLELPAAARMRLGPSERFPFAKKESVYAQEDDRFKVPFFKVSPHKGNILVSNPELLELVINKSRQEVMDFHTRLVDEKRLSIEMLPENPTIDNFLHFFEIVVNHKTLWRSFAVWFGLGGQLEEKIYNYFDVWNIGFRNVEMKVVGNEKSFDKEGKIHTLYLLSIQRKHNHQHDSSDNQVIILKKRYSDFFALNKEVLKFISKNKLKGDQLPQMPPKLSPFGSKTSPKSRLARFDHYIKQLIKIEGINHCIKLLEFLEVNNLSSSAELYETEEQVGDIFESSQRSYFSDLSHPN